jgi:hypothetical protein
VARRKKRAVVNGRLTRPIWRTAAIEHYAPLQTGQDVTRNTLLEREEPGQYRIGREKPVWESGQKQRKLKRPLRVTLDFNCLQSRFVVAIARSSIISAFKSKKPKRPIMKHGDSQADYPRRRFPISPTRVEWRGE